MAAPKPLANISVATTSFSGRLKSELVDVRQGELFFSDDPIVAKWPEFFGPPTVRGRATDLPIEQATAGPGEKRGA